jgi:hypothetical protein
MNKIFAFPFYMYILYYIAVLCHKKALRTSPYLLVLWIRIRIGSGFNGVPGSVSGFTIQIRIQVEKGK